MRNFHSTVTPLSLMFYETFSLKRFFLKDCFPQGSVAAPNRMNFQKSAKGGEGSFSIQKNYVVHFGSFKQEFLSMKLIQNSNFRVQGMIFSTIVLRKIKTRHTLQKACAVGCFKKTLLKKNKKRNPPRISRGVSLNRSKRIFDFDQV